MGSNAVDILARLRLNAQNFTTELQRELGQAEQKFGNTGNVIGRNLASGIGGGLQQATAQVPLFGVALSGLSGIALGAAASVGAITLAISKGVEEAEAWQRSVRQLDAVLNAGGNRTGQTRKELIDFSGQIESSFAIAEEEVLKAEAVLSTFDGVSGETFKRAIKDAGDLAAVFGGDLGSNSEKLGTILQNLAQGNVEGLRKGFKFLGTETIDTIEQLAKAGKTAEATERFMAALESKVGGAGEANAKGVSGAMFRLKDAVGDATREFVIQTGIYAGVESGLNKIADAASNAATSMSRMNGIEISGSFLTWLSRQTGGSMPMLGILGPAMGLAGGAIQARGAQGRRDRILDDVTGTKGVDAMREAFAVVKAANDSAKENERVAAENARKREEERLQRERTATRTPEQVFKDFEAALAREGVQHASGRYGFRTTADQREIHAHGESTLDGVDRPSRHQVWQAFDPSRATADDEKARRAAAAAGLKGFQIVNESGGRKHYQWTGATSTKGDALAAQIEDQERAAAEQKRKDDERKKAIEEVLKASRQQLDIDVESVRLADLRARGLDRQADIEEQLAELGRKGAEQLAKLPESESRVTDGLQDQLSAVWNQSKAYAELLRAHGDRTALTEADKEAEAEVAAAIEAGLEKARDTAKTAADRLAIEEAILQVKHQVTNAEEDGAKAAAEHNKVMKERKDEAERQFKEQQERERRNIEDLADFYERAFRSGGKSIWKDFKDEGLHMVATIAAKWTLALLSGQKLALPNILAELTANSGSGGGGIAGLVAGLLGGAAGGGGKSYIQGSFAEGILPGDQHMPSSMGGMGDIGAMAGAAGPAGAAVALNQGLARLLHLNPTTALFAGVAGALLIKALKPTKKGSATLGFDSFGTLGVSSTKGNSKARIDAASQGIEGLADTLQQIADQLGGTIGGSASLSLGLRKKNWRLDPLGLGRTKGAGVLDFGQDQEAAIRAAISEALRDGVVQGISDASKRILASGQDLQKAIEKASLIEAIPAALKARLDPVGAAVDELNKKWTATIAALKEGGATAEQMADAQKLYNLELADAKTETAGAAGGLKDFLDSLSFGSASPFSLRDQEAKAEAALRPFLDQIDAKQAIDQQGYQDAAKAFLDIERELGGSTNQFFDKLSMIQDYTNRAIAAIDNAKPIRTFADPFAESTAQNTGAMADMMEQTNGLIDIRGALSSLGGGGGGDFIGGGGGFSSAVAMY
jgi:hypothetical protein